MNGVRREKLLSLLGSALKTCEQLRDYTDEHHNVFTQDDDDMLLEVLNHRDALIETLTATENAIDDVLSDTQQDDPDQAMPPEAEEIRRSVRAILDEITSADMEIMKLVGGKMQKYKGETLKARSRQSFAAYVRSISFGQSAGDGFDLSK